MSATPANRQFLAPLAVALAWVVAITAVRRAPAAASAGGGVPPLVPTPVPLNDSHMASLTQGDPSREDSR